MDLFLKYLKKIFPKMEKFAGNQNVYMLAFILNHFIINQNKNIEIKTTFTTNKSLQNNKLNELEDKAKIVAGEITIDSFYKNNYKINTEILDSNEMKNIIAQPLKRFIVLNPKKTIEISDSNKTEFISFIEISKIKKFLSNDEFTHQLDNKLFNNNIRSFLGNNKVNKDITNSLINDSKDNWWIKNNGITILAFDLKYEFINDRWEMKLTKPQIVNGQQTSYSIYNSNPKNENIKILVKFKKIDINKNKDEYMDIVTATNNQSPIQVFDLISNEDIFIELLRYQEEQNHKKH